MKIFNKYKLITLALVALFSFSLTRNAFASDEISLQLSPTRNNPTLDPGAHYEGQITLTNSGSSNFEYKMFTSPYQVDSEYEAVYDVHNGYTQITNWISFPEPTGTVLPGEVKIVDYTIDVPEDAPGGGQFAVIFAGTNDAGRSVRYGANIGMILMAHINGETREEGKILETKIPSFVLNPPLNVTIRLENTGNIDEEIKNSLEIKDFFSNTVLYEDKEPQTNTLLPGTSRTITLVTNDIPRLGVMKVTLTTEYLNDAQIKTATVFVCPLWFIAIIVLIIATIIFRILAKKRDDRRTRTNSRNSAGSADKFNI